MLSITLHNTVNDQKTLHPFPPIPSLGLLTHPLYTPGRTHTHILAMVYVCVLFSPLSSQLPLSISLWDAFGTRARYTTLRLCVKDYSLSLSLPLPLSLLPILPLSPPRSHTIMSAEPLWMVLKDPQGRRYYYNSQFKFTTWDRPEELRDARAVRVK